MDSGFLSTSAGPLADRSGGLITFQAGSVGEAESLVANDPFMRAELLRDRVGERVDGGAA